MLNIDLYFYLVLASLFLRHVHVHLGRRSTSQIQEVPLVIRSEQLNLTLPYLLRLRTQIISQ